MSDRIIVLKFGGSVLNLQSLERIPEIVREYLERWKVVVVVSALSRYPFPYATDTLLKLLSPNGSSDGLPHTIRDFVLSTGEMIASGLVAASLHRKGIPSEPLAGFQAGVIVLDGGKVEIGEVHPNKVLEVLESGKVPVICGFQGISPEGRIVTLPRGGSDLTAVALAHALRAEHVVLVKDVDGVLSADPKTVRNPHLHQFISYEELGELTYNGSKLVQPDAVALSQKLELPIYIRSLEKGGTWVGSRPASTLITAVTRKASNTWFKIRLRSHSEVDVILRDLAEELVSLDFISLFQRDNSIILSYTVSQAQADKVRRLLRKERIPFTYRKNVAKVSVVGAGIRGKPGVFHRIYRALQRGGLLPIQVSDSHISISFLFPEELSEKAVRELHNEFFNIT